VETYAEQSPKQDAEEVRRQLQRVLDSPEFQATDRQREFLQFVIEKTIAGQSHEIKGYTIATQVFGRKEDFDQATDPIVSIQAGQLRRALERYYLTAGKHEPIRIEIPKGTYVPAFQRQAATGLDHARGHGETPEIRYDDAWPTVLIRPFRNLTGDPRDDYVGLGLATELATEIARFQEIRVAIDRPGASEKAPAYGVARFVIDGNIRKDMAGIKVAVSLTDHMNNKHVWGEKYQCHGQAAQLIAFQEEIARAVAAKVTGERGVISRTLSPESRNKPPSELKTYEAFLRYYEYDQTLTPESFVRAMEALKRAAELEPQSGPVWSMLGRLYANVCSLEIPGFEDPLEKALEFAQKGAQLSPDNQRARLVLSLVLMFAGEVPAALAETERALTLNPNSLFMLDGVGYLLTLLGEWERGPALIRTVMQLNPYYGLFVHYALWVDWVRREEYDRAYLETLNFRRPSLFWEPLMKAAVFGHLGRDEEGKRAVENLLELKPDFPSRGRTLIRYYIKFDDIAERTISGLGKVGLIIQ